MERVRAKANYYYIFYRLFIGTSLNRGGKFIALVCCEILWHLIKVPEDLCEYKLNSDSHFCMTFFV